MSVGDSSSIVIWLSCDSYRDIALLVTSNSVKSCQIKLLHLVVSGECRLELLRASAEDGFMACPGP